MNESINYLDLDAIAPDVELVVKLGGKEHRMRPLSVEDFVKNIKDQSALAASNSDVEAEIDLVIKMLIRAFPTMKGEDLKKVELNKLWKLLEFARDNNGAKTAEGDIKAEQEQAENPQTAG